MTNNLGQESSLYLRQHANNPVWWQPWGEQAWQLAREENKPVIVSIGYSSCHWCHVMEHHCFEDDEVAEVMNKHFICIKVDREERPDVDAVYMDAIHMMGLQGGWPLNVITTPDGAPFYGGTYFPKQQWMHILNQIAIAHAETPEELLNAGEGFRNALKGGASAAKPTSGTIDWNRAIEKIKRQFDGDRGGVGQAPKFPMPNLYQFLLSYSVAASDAQLRKQVITTLEAMAFGGIYDHIGGGFCRYSTDADWHVPHFEKMLYDNGQLLSLYAKAYQLDSNLLYRDVCLHIIEFLGREMKADNGAFYASIDADSEGVEGKFYVWTKSEFDNVVGARLAEHLAPFYQVTEEGNWEHGLNVLARNQTEEAYAAQNLIGESQFHRLVIEGRSKLFAARDLRIKPVTDRKILTCWNALTINGLTDVFRFTQDASALRMAIDAVEYVMDSCYHEGKLQRLPNANGKAPAYLDDYAALALACLNLFQATFQQKYAEYAIRLVDTALITFNDPVGDSFLFLDTGADPNLISRYKERFDNVVPSSNSMLCHALLILYHFTLDEQYEKAAQKLLDQAAPMVTEGLRHASNWAHCHHLATSELMHFQVIGPNALNFRVEIDQLGLPFYLISGAHTFSNLRSLSDKKPPQKKTGIWLCRNSACLPPVFRVEDLELA